MQFCLNKICNTRYVAGWEQWVAVHKAMIRAGRLMHRVMCKFTDNQTVMGWDRWQEVEGDQKRAAAIMLRCLNHIEHQYEAEGYSAWLELVAESRELERSRSAEENAEARIRALEQAHALVDKFSILARKAR